MPIIVLPMRKRLLIITIVFCSTLFVAPSSSFSSSSNTTTATATSHPDEFKCSLNQIFKPNLYKKKTITANIYTKAFYHCKTELEGEFPNKAFCFSRRSCVFRIPTPTSPAHHDQNHQIFRAGARVPATSSTRDRDIGDPTISHNSKRRSNAWIIFFLAIGIFILLLLLITAYLLCRRKVVPDAGNNQEFSFATVCEATQNFNIENRLGQGGFGPVYKGTLASGKRMAVKRLESTRRSGQGILQFRNEVDFIPRLQHKNIVELLGYYFEGSEMLIVYEFMPNRSLDAHLFDLTNRSVVPLDWETQKKIIKGIARGLVYLHEDSRLKIIHRDIKSSNVLLDDEMNPKISDFGLAKLLKDNQSEANTTTKVGTFGYMAPEYCMGGVISSKSDVYSFGVVLLEIISGLKSLDPKLHSLGLPNHTWELWCRRSGIELMDKAMAQSSVDSEEVLRWIHIGLLCVQEDTGKRPYMSEVLRMLENRNIKLLGPTRPPLSVDQPDLEASQQSSCSTIYLDAEAGLSVDSVNLVTSQSSSNVASNNTPILV